MPVVVGDPQRVESRPVLWRITDRRAFARLRRDGARADDHGVSVIWVPPVAEDRPAPRVAFAAGRRVGGAVGRNRLRRRLRAACRELAAAGRLPAGDYLIGAGPDLADRPWPALLAALEGAIARATGSRT